MCICEAKLTNSRTNNNSGEDGCIHNAYKLARLCEGFAVEDVNC